MSYICTYIATECQNRFENLINRKLSIFYIETMYQLFFQLQPKNIFFRDQKYFSKKNRPKIFFGENPEKNLKCENFCPKLEISDFPGFSPKNNFCCFFFEFFFDPEKKYFLVGVGKKVGIWRRLLRAIPEGVVAEFFRGPTQGICLKKKVAQLYRCRIRSRIQWC